MRLFGFDVFFYSFNRRIRTFVFFCLSAACFYHAYMRTGGFSNKVEFPAESDLKMTGPYSAEERYVERQWGVLLNGCGFSSQVFLSKTSFPGVSDSKQLVSGLQGRCAIYAWTEPSSRNISVWRLVADGREIISYKQAIQYSKIKEETGWLGAKAGIVFGIVGLVSMLGIKKGGKNE